MALKAIILIAFAVTAHAGIITGPFAQPAQYAYSTPAIARVAAPLAYAAPVANAVVAEHIDPHPQYQFAYDIHDALTGDFHSHQENRDGHNVQGSYSLVEPDGSRRIVDYTADHENGFNAVVRKEPAVAPAVAKVVSPVAYAAPANTIAYATPARIAAPVGYAHI